MSKKFLQFSVVGLAALIWLSFQVLPPSGSTEASPPTKGAPFDPSQQPPTLLRPGDRVRFTVERVAS